MAGTLARLPWLDPWFWNPYRRQQDITEQMWVRAIDWLKKQIDTLKEGGNFRENNDNSYIYEVETDILALGLELKTKASPSKSVHIKPIDEIRLIDSAFDRRREAAFLLSLSLGRPCTVQEALDFYESKNLFRGPWEQNERERAVNMRAICRFLVKFWKDGCGKRNSIHLESEKWQRSLRYLTHLWQEASKIFACFEFFRKNNNLKEASAMPTVRFKEVYKLFGWKWYWTRFKKAREELVRLGWIEIDTFMVPGELAWTWHKGLCHPGSGKKKQLVSLKDLKRICKLLSSSSVLEEEDLVRDHLLYCIPIRNWVFDKKLLIPSLARPPPNNNQEQLTNEEAKHGLEQP